MDLLGDEPVLDMSLENFRIYSRNSARPPQHIGPNANIQNSMISEGCVINGTVINSVLSGGIVIEEGAVVRNSVIMEDVTVRSGATVDYAIIDCDTVVCENAVVGNEHATKDDIVVVARGREVK